MREFIDSIDPIYIRILTFTISAIVIYIATKRILNKFYSRLQEQDKWYFTKKIVMNAIYVVIFIMFIFTFSDRFQGLYTTLGLAGAGITFALREVIVSFAGWFAILFGDFFKVGDRVLLGGIKGDVIDLGILRTTLMEMGDWVDGDQYNGRIVRVANSFIFTSPVYNYSANFNFVWDEIHLPIHFGSDVKLVRKILKDVSAEILGDVSTQAKDAWFQMRRQFRLEDATLENQIFMTFDDNWIEFSLRYVVDIKERRITKDLIFTRLLEELDKYEEEIQLASQTIELVKQN
ncbi:mechanosensitive ion channel family protein [Alkalibacter mobilis]|uniref:mechanosensitive ion channel family protein n=1 Tax=Alkalibacter mobilis TaxID=2787712 RepID=UPI00189C8965|nr:mechanosensitive ion channel domain-containing protein [Alkalibacter mobilis]MBF7096656.1 mechanosensitive ion channel [Alkalibacter mobilis]